MAVISPPAWAQNGVYTAQIDRLVLDGFLKSSGITSLGSFAVAQETPASMNVVVDRGTAYVRGQETAYQGWYHILNENPVALNVPASNSTNPRIDLVYIRIHDQAYFGTENAASIQIQTGVPDPSPSVPTITGTYLPLAQIYVAAGATVITNANITSLRPVARFKDSMTQVLATPPETWRSAVAEGIIATNWNNPVSGQIGTIQYRLFNGCVEFQGGARTTAAIDGSGGSTTSTILTLPTGYRPARSCLCKVLLETATNTTGAASAGTAHTHTIPEQFRAARVNVLTSGVVQLNVSHSTSGYRWSVPANAFVMFNQVKFPLGLSA
jgi:hypothetical protein